MKELLTTLYAYNCWGHARILDNSRQLTLEQYSAPAMPGGRSLHDLLSHTLRTEWMWACLAQHGRLPGEFLQEADLPGLDAIASRWQVEQERLHAYLDGLDETSLELEMELVSPRGGHYTYRRWQMLLHLMNHSMQHRTEAADLLTRFGRSPGDLDLIFFLAALAS